MFGWLKKLLPDPEARRAAIAAAISADDWLLYCAQNGAGYCGSFDLWWRLASFDKGVRERFVESNPSMSPPSKDEIKKVLLQILEGGPRVRINSESRLERVS